MTPYIQPITEIISIETPTAFAASGNTENMGSKDGIWDAASLGGDSPFYF